MKTLHLIIIKKVYNLTIYIDYSIFNNLNIDIIILILIIKLIYIVNFKVYNLN